MFKELVVLSLRLVIVLADVVVLSLESPEDTAVRDQQVMTNDDLTYLAAAHVQWSSWLD
jgi:hypothetical protein